jgi:Sigma-70 region 2
VTATTSGEGAATSFDPPRPRLIRIAYRMLGSVADAEDVVQDAFLRWLGADHDAVLEPEAYPRRVVTRLCLNQLKSARGQRETYVGPWLPEPLVEAEEESIHDVTRCSRFSAPVRTRVPHRARGGEKIAKIAVRETRPAVASRFHTGSTQRDLRLRGDPNGAPFRRATHSAGATSSWVSAGPIASKTPSRRMSAWNSAAAICIRITAKNRNAR